MVYFEENFDKLCEILDQEDDVFVVYDKAVESYAYDFIAEEWHVKGIEAGESAKTMDMVEEICRWLMLEGADRDALVVAVGGGTTTDLVGFAAGVYKRGVRCAYVPTTLLAQVDAAIGGKCAVNLDGFKNEIGIFREPMFIYINPNVLETLEPYQWQSGMGELVKTFILFDKKRFNNVVKAKSIGLEDIKACVEYKEKIVDEDPTEHGSRRLLNLGHTFGHAIETYELNNAPEGERLTHGECVAAGICIAARMSGAALGKKITKALFDMGLPTGTNIPADQLIELIRFDKKTYGDSVKMILLEDIGKPYIEEIKIDDLYKRIG